MLMYHTNVDFEVFCEICNFEDFFWPNMKVSDISRDHKEDFSFLVLKKRITAR